MTITIKDVDLPDNTKTIAGLYYTYVDENGLPCREYENVKPEQVGITEDEE